MYMLHIFTTFSFLYPTFESVPDRNVSFCFGLCDAAHCQFTQEYFDSLGKQLIAAMKDSKLIGSEIADSTRPKKHWHSSKQPNNQRHIKTRINIQCKARRINISAIQDTLFWSNSREASHVSFTEKSIPESTVKNTSPQKIAFKIP